MIFKMYVSTNLCSLFDYLYWPLWPVLGIVVQLVTTMLLQGGSCGFEPRQSQLIQWFESFPLLKFCLVCLTFTLSQLILSYFHINLLNSILSCEGNVFLLTKFYFNAECVCVCVYVCMFCLLYCGVACHIVYHKIYYSQNTDYNRISIKNISMIPLGFPFM